jgi:phage/plasmid-associated DNA primase
MANMNYNLHELLKDLSENDDDKNYTHVTTYDNTKWVIHNQNMTSLWEQYCALVHKEATNDESHLCLAEYPMNDMPLIQEFIFKFEDDGADNWEPYDEQFICWLCYLYQKILKDFFNIVDSQQLTVVVLESINHWIENDTKGEYLLFKLRIQFPYAKISVKEQDTLIRQEMMTLLRKNNIMAKMQRQPMGDWDSMMSKNIKSTPILLYGSQSTDKVPKLKLIHIWPDIALDLLESNEEPGELDIDDVFTINDHTLVFNGVINTQIFKDDLINEYWLPLYLSIHYGSNVLLLKNNTKKKRKNDVSYAFNKDKTKVIKEDALDFAETLLKLINPNRFLQESFWLDIGRALYNTNCKNGLLMWTKYTLQVTKMLTKLPLFINKLINKHDLDHVDIVTEACRQQYDTFGTSHISVKTLGIYAREDDLEGYKKWHTQWCVEAMETALSGLEVDVCEALYRFHWLDFVYDNHNKKWFHFKHGWSETSEGVLLKKDISNNFMKKFEEIRVNLSLQSKDSDEEQFKKDSDVTLKKLNLLICKLKTVPFKSKLMIEAKEKFEFDRFSSLLNKNRELTGVKNGVLEVIGQDIIFRKAKPEDFVSMSTSVPFHDYFHWEHPLVVETMNWMFQTYEEDLAHHFLKFSSSGFIGKNIDKILPILTGNGDNSKSMIIKLFEETFGPYLVKVPASLFTEKKADSGNATPQIAQMRDCRWAIMDEADNEISMKKNAIKKFTGGDSFFGRFLQENGGKIDLTAKIMVITNDVPPITEADEAVKKRIKIIPHLRKWVDDPEAAQKTDPNTKYFKKDTQFEKRIPVLASAFLWILTQYFPRYMTEGLQDPPTVVEYTEEYWKNNDVYGIFISERTTEVYKDNQPNERDTSSTVSMNDLLQEFKSFFRTSYPSDSVPGRDIIKSQMVKRWGRYPKGGWQGYALVDGDNLITAFAPTKFN